MNTLSTKRQNKTNLENFFFRKWLLGLFGDDSNLSASFLLKTLRFSRSPNLLLQELTLLEAGGKTRAGNRSLEPKSSRQRAGRTAPGPGSFGEGRGFHQTGARPQEPCREPGVQNWLVTAGSPPQPRTTLGERWEAICAEASYNAGPLARTKIRNSVNGKRHTGRGALVRARRGRGLGHILAAARERKTRAVLSVRARVRGRVRVTTGGGGYPERVVPDAPDVRDPLSTPPTSPPKSREHGGPHAGLSWTWNFQLRSLPTPQAPGSRRRGHCAHREGERGGGDSGVPAVPSLPWT